MSRRRLGKAQPPRDPVLLREPENISARNQRLLQAIVNKGWEGVVLSNRAGEVIWCNESVPELLGVRETDLIGKKPEQARLIDPLDLASAMRFRRRLRQTPGGTLAIEVRLRRTDGSLRWIEYVATNLLDDPDVGAIVGKFRDITERHEAEERVRRAQRMFQTIVDEGWEGLLLNDRDGIIRYCNRAAERLLGVDAAELIGRPAARLLDLRDLEKAYQFRDTLRKRAGGTLTTEVRLRRRDGSIRWMEFTATNLLDDPDVGAVVGKFRDITESKQSQEAIEALSQRVIRLQQEEERRIARELHDSTSQALTALMLNLGSVAQASLLSRELARKLAESVGLARQVAGEIRTASYLLHPPTLDDFGLIPALREYARGFAQRSGISVRFRAPRRQIDGLSTQAEMAIFRIVQESLANVHRHSASKSAEVIVTSDRKNFAVQISDRGKGIPQRVVTAMQVESPSSWLGVGLNGIRQRVSQLKGKMEIKRRSPGTAIRVEIPIGA